MVLRILVSAMFLSCLCIRDILFMVMNNICIYRIIQCLIDTCIQYDISQDENSLLKQILTGNLPGTVPDVGDSKKSEV